MAALVAVSSTASADVQRRLGGVTITCDGKGYCSAMLRAKGDADKASQIVLTRGPDQRARWNVMFSTPGALADRDRAVSLSIDNGVDIPLRPGSDYDAFVRPSDFYLLSQSALDRLMLQIQNGHDLRLSYMDIAGAPHTDRFPLDGFSQSLAAIDGEQGRIVGDRRAGPPSGLPSAPRADKAGLIAADGVPPRLNELHAALGDCEAADGPGLAGKTPVIGGLSDTSMLYALPCFTSSVGTGYRLYEAERGEIGGLHRLLFAVYSDRLGWSGADTLFDVAFDPVAHRLTGTLLDETGCAEAGSWVWDASAFRLERLDRRAGCAGREARTLYPAN